MISETWQRVQFSLVQLNESSGVEYSGVKRVDQQLEE
jgi:hypothetical protein